MSRIRTCLHLSGPLRVLIVAYITLSANPGGAAISEFPARLFNISVARHLYIQEEFSDATTKLLVGETMLNENDSQACPDNSCCIDLEQKGITGTYLTPEWFAIPGQAALDEVLDGVPYQVIVVLAMENVGGAIGPVLGATRQGQRKSAIVYDAPADVWVHELGHAVGLNDTVSCATLIMNKPRDISMGDPAAVTEYQCQTFYNGSDDRSYTKYCGTSIGPGAIAIGESYRVRLVWNETEPNRDVTYTISRSTSCWGPFTTIAQIQSHDPDYTPDSLFYTYLDTSASTSRTYYYRLSAPGELVTAAAAPSPGYAFTLGAPSNLHGNISVSGSVGQVALSWSPVGGATGYAVYRAPYGGLDGCSNQVSYIGTTTNAAYLDQGLTTSPVPIGYRVRALNNDGLSDPSNEIDLIVSGRGGAYMYLDTNGDSVNDSTDIVSPTGSTTFDVWLRTDRNRQGAYTTCIDGSGEPNGLRSYSFALKAIGGTVAWSQFVNLQAEFTVPTGAYADSIHYWNGRLTAGSIKNAGTYLLARITGTPLSGTPYVVIVPSVTHSPEDITGYGSNCPGTGFDNTLRLGIDWFDTDGAGPFDTWVPDGIRLVTGLGDQIEPAITPDGFGGAIVVWEDNRAGPSDKNIYAQRIDPSGNPYWSNGGIAISTNPATQRAPRIVSDGAGGAIVAWEDLRNGSDGDIYAQRIDDKGVVRWSVNGIPICTAALAQRFPFSSRRNITADGAGGAIVVWTDSRAGGSFHGDIYAQKVNPDGVVQWAVNGVNVCPSMTPDPFQYEAVAVSDGIGGAIVAWVDYRNDPNQCICVGSQDIYCQRVDAAGSLRWAASGVPISEALGDQWMIDPVADGAGGAIFAWEDARVSQSQRDIYAQRVDSTGTAKWGLNGVAVNAATGSQQQPSITTDRAKGAIVVWGGATPRVQRLDSNGALKWNPSGIALMPSGVVSDPVIASDEAGGAVVVWTHETSPHVLRGQRFNSSGAPVWSSGGVSIAIPGLPRTQLASDGSGGVIAAWQGFIGSDDDILAMRIAPGGGGYTTDVAESPDDVPLTSLGPAYPNPFNPSVTIRLALETAGRARVVIYDVSGRKVRTLLDKIVPAGLQTVRWDGINEEGKKMPSGIYYCKLEALGTKLTRTLALVK